MVSAAGGAGDRAGPPMIAQGRRAAPSGGLIGTPIGVDPARAAPASDRWVPHRNGAGPKRLEASDRR